MANIHPIYTEDELQQEAWKAVPTWEGIYEASSLGRIKRITPTYHASGSRIRKFGEQKQHYLEAMLSKGKRRKNYHLHVLIAATFLGPRPNGAQVNHKNGIKRDNRVVNLEYVTAKENTAHSIKNGFHDPHKCAAKLTIDLVHLIRLPTTHIPSLARELNMDKSTLYNVRKGKTFQHVPFRRTSD